MTSTTTSNCRLTRSSDRLSHPNDLEGTEKICPSGGSIGRRFGVDSESVSDLSHRIGVSEMAEYWEKVQHTSARPHIDLVPGRNGTGTRLTRADT
jgi:hypothetical protein